ncbi:MAG TPA: transcriptional regulator NrdR [Clostridiales bacterium]|nr:transcriptional regulator NrdR [Clostridiales bacterium]
MKCIYCGCKDSKVIDSRYMEDTNSIRRRRECLNPNCQKRFNTYETIELLPIMVVKNDQSRQAFNPIKIKQGIMKACEKRPVSVSQINEMVNDIEKQIQNSLKQEISSSEIGEMIMERLKKIDEVAYIRFASVYRKFTDVTHFMDFIKEFENMINKKD